MYALGVLICNLKYRLNYLSHHVALSITCFGFKIDTRVYTDSDWGSDRNTRRSTSEYMVCMAGDSVAWISRLQPKVTRSSMEAEYAACFLCTAGGCEVCQLLLLLFSV